MPKNIGVDISPFLQWIFLTQESNWGLRPGFPALQADSLLTELSGKPELIFVRRLAIWSVFHD